MPRPKGYSRTQIALHWVAFLLIVQQFVLHEGIAEAWDLVEDGGVPAFDPIVAAHVFGGMAVLAFALWRLVLRRSRGVPDLPAGGSALTRAAAHLGHHALYALMILMPVSGALAWFGGLEAAGEAHEAMKPLMLLLVAVHVLAAFWHQFWLKDGLLARMKRAAD